MSSLAQASEEMRLGKHASAEIILNGILGGTGEITSHALFDLTGTYEELCRASGRYQDLIRFAGACAEKAHGFPEIDQHIHNAHCLIVIAGAEKALGRIADAERDARTAEQVLNRFPSEHFGPSSREKVTRLRVKLKALRKAIGEDARPPITRSQESTSTNPNVEWRSFVSRRNMSAKDLKEYLNGMHRASGQTASAETIVNWAMETPRAGSLGTTAEMLLVLIEYFVFLTTAHSSRVETQYKLLRLVEGWEKEQGQWLQRLIRTKPRLGLADKLQRFRRGLETNLQRAVDSVENELNALTVLSSDEILDGGQDHEAALLGLDARLNELNKGIPAPFVPRVTTLRTRLDGIVARVDQELHRRNETYAGLLKAVGQAPDRSALAYLRRAVKQQLPLGMQTRPEMEQAFRQADDRFVLAEVEALEKQERAAHLAKLASVQGVNLATLLFREYGIDLPTARQMVIDYNRRHIDLEGLLNMVLQIKRNSAGQTRLPPS